MRNDVITALFIVVMSARAKFWKLPKSPSLGDYERIYACSDNYIIGRHLMENPWMEEPSGLQSMGS